MNPTPTEYKSSQYEFNDEQNRTFSDLATSMGTVSTLMKLLGLVFVIFLGLHLYFAIKVKAETGVDAYAPAAGLGAGALLCLAIGFWTGSATHSFRRIVETKNEDIWHLMNAMTSLKNMYGLLRSIIMLCLLLAVVGLALVGFALANRPG